MKKDSSKSERKGLQDSSDTYVVGFGDSGIVGKTGDRAGGGG